MRPRRIMGWRIRSGESTRRSNRRTFAQIYPSVSGERFEPSISRMRSPSTVTSRAQRSGQSSGQTEGRMAMGRALRFCHVHRNRRRAARHCGCARAPRRRARPGCGLGLARRRSGARRFDRPLGRLLDGREARGAIATFELSPRPSRAPRFDRRARGARERGARVRAGDRLGGHIVQGHVDGLGSVASIAKNGDWIELAVQLPSGLARYCVEKGSISLDGVSSHDRPPRGPPRRDW